MKKLFQMLAAAMLAIVMLITMASSNALASDISSDADIANHKIGDWVFTASDASRERTGKWGPIDLKGDAKLTPDGLVLGKGNWAQVRGYKGAPIKDKTLVAWVSLNNVSDMRQSGSTMTIDAITKDQFDGIVFGERANNTWVPGSTQFLRTMDPDPKTVPDAVEKTSSSAPFKPFREVVQVAISYAPAPTDTTSAKVILSRNGQQLFEYTKGTLETWQANDVEMLFGVRHTNGDYIPGYLDGTIVAAQLYDTALTVEQIAALAPQPPSRAITTFYGTKQQQEQAVKNLHEGKDGLNKNGTGGQNSYPYMVAIPNHDISSHLPDNVENFKNMYKSMLENARRTSGVSGSFTQGWFDFQLSTPKVAGSNRGFSVDAPLNTRLYSVVAGLPELQCPLKIKSTSITFFDNEKAAQDKAKALGKEGYLVYVSPDDDLTTEAFSKLFYDQDTGKKKVNPDCFSVSGATEKVTIDFSQIFYLLPSDLQQPAKQTPSLFQYGPKSKSGDFIYLINARKKM